VEDPTPEEAESAAKPKRGRRKKDKTLEDASTPTSSMPPEVKAMLEAMESVSGKPKSTRRRKAAVAAAAPAEAGQFPSPFYRTI
jgi:ribonuclease E